MLIDIDSGKARERVPYAPQFDILRARLSEGEFEAMVARINELIDASGAEIATAGWLPGSDWTGTPFEPIYTKAARGDFDRSAMFFGQLVWYAIMHRPEAWGRAGTRSTAATSAAAPTSGSTREEGAMRFGFLKRSNAAPVPQPATPEDAILAVLDQGCRDFVFPILDNGYVYLAAARLSLHRSEADWAIVFEIFGFSPRAGAPDIGVWSFGSRLANRKSREDYVSENAYRNYLHVHPHDDAAFFFPLGEGWQDPDGLELVAAGARTLTVRGKEVAIPGRDELRRFGIEPTEPDHERVRTFEVCRYVAAVEHEHVLATPEERRTHVPPGLTEVLVLDDWHHPDAVTGEVASQTAAFRSIARVLATGDITAYDASERANTHWSNWPDGGSL